MFLLAFFAASAKITKFKGDKGDIPVTYYSMVKPQHVDTKMCLSSLEIAYQGGSKQQMTRAIRAIMLAETLWTIYPGRNITHVHQGDQLKCGDVVRLRHATTATWLHSHDFDSQLGNGLEVSATSEGEDDGNDWMVECVGEDEEAVAASAQGLEDGEGVGEGLCLRRDEGEEVLGKGFEERAAGGAGCGPGREYALGIERAEAAVVARFLPGEAEGVGEALEVEPVFVYFPHGIVGPELLVVGGIEA